MFYVNGKPLSKDEPRAALIVSLFGFIIFIAIAIYLIHTDRNHNIDFNFEYVLSEEQLFYENYKNQSFETVFSGVRIKYDIQKRKYRRKYGTVSLFLDKQYVERYYEYKEQWKQSETEEEKKQINDKLIISYRLKDSSSKCFGYIKINKQ